MAQFGLREAAEQAGTSKSSIWRAIKSGRLSATKTDGGDYSIDAAELFRVFPPKASGETMERVPERPTGQTGTGVETGGETDETELRLRLASADAMITGLKELLAEVRQSRDQWQAQADEWKAQAEDWKTQTTRLTLALPAPAPGLVATPEASEPRQSWFRWWFGWRSAG